MPASQPVLNVSPEDFLARLTTAAYGVALRHGIKGPFIELELDMWRELRGVVCAALAGQDTAPPAPSRQATGVWPPAVQGVG